MDFDALVLLLCGGIVATQVIRALVWLIALPSGALLDAMVSAEPDEEDDLHCLRVGKRNRYRELRR